MLKLRVCQVALWSLVGRCRNYWQPALIGCWLQGSTKDWIMYNRGLKEGPSNFKLTELQHRTNRYKYLGYAVCCMPRNHPVLLEHYVLICPNLSQRMHSLQFICWCFFADWRKDLAEGEPATTLVVCPHVKAWQSFETFQEFYQGQLMNGYFFAEKARMAGCIGASIALRIFKTCWALSFKNSWFGFSIKEPDDAESSNTGQGQSNPKGIVGTGQVQIL